MDTGKNLSDVIKSHFKQVKNSFHFGSGLTLNQLASSMAEVIENDGDHKHGVQPNVISLVIKGERQFTDKHAKAFCQVLDLDKVRSAEVFYALVEGKVRGAMGYILEGLVAEEIEILLADVDRIRQLRIAGSDQLAVEHGEGVVARLDLWIARLPKESKSLIQCEDLRMQAIAALV